MKIKNKILIIVTLVCVLVSSLAISSFAYLATDSDVLVFPSASFSVYTNNTSGDVLVRSSTVRQSSVNTGNALTGVRSRWNALPVLSSVRLDCSSNKSISCSVTDLVYPVFLNGVSSDIYFEWNLYANSSVDTSYPVLDSSSGFIEIGFYRWYDGVTPSYESRSWYVSSTEAFSFISALDLSDSDDNDDSILVTSVYFALSNVYQEDYASEGDLSYGSVTGGLQFEFVSDLGVDSSLNVRNGIDILNQAFLNSSYDVGYSEGYTTGQIDGIQIGYDEGYYDGYNRGQLDGYDSGFSAGESQGLATGYLNGYNEGLVIGENQGFIAGKIEGKEEGYVEGYDQGLIDGEAISAPENWFDGIFGAVGGFLGTNLFGDFSIGGVLAVIIGFSCFMWILKIFAGG